MSAREVKEGSSSRDGGGRRPRHGRSTCDSSSRPGRQGHVKTVVGTYSKRLRRARLSVPDCCASSHYSASRTNILLTRHRISRRVGVFANEVSSNPVYAGPSESPDARQAELDLRQILATRPTKLQLDCSRSRSRSPLSEESGLAKSSASTCQTTTSTSNHAGDAGWSEASDSADDQKSTATSASAALASMKPPMTEIASRLISILPSWYLGKGESCLHEVTVRTYQKLLKYNPEVASRLALSAISKEVSAGTSSSSAEENDVAVSLAQLSRQDVSVISQNPSEFRLQIEGANDDNLSVEDFTAAFDETFGNVESPCLPGGEQQRQPLSENVGNYSAVLHGSFVADQKSDGSASPYSSSVFSNRRNDPDCTSLSSASRTFVDCLTPANDVTTISAVNIDRNWATVSRHHHGRSFPTTITISTRTKGKHERNARKRSSALKFPF